MVWCRTNDKALPCLRYSEAAAYSGRIEEVSASEELTVYAWIAEMLTLHRLPAQQAQLGDTRCLGKPERLKRW
jgi:hypothetical protein